MKTIDFSQLGGLHFYQDTLEIMQGTYVNSLGALATGLGDKLIVHGVEDLGATISSGWVIIGGKLMPFVGGSKSPQVVVEELKESESYDDSSVKEVYTTTRAKLGSVGGFPFSELRRLRSDAINLDDSDVLASAKAVKRVQDNLLSLLGFEPAIILKGCEVTGVNNTGANTGTLNIDAGVVMMDGAIVSTAAYSGAFPVYLKPDGTFQTGQPAGTSILFNPYTSQRYADVLKRAVTPVGKIEMYKTLSDRFDSSGLGRWEMAGFKICDDMQSRVPLAYDRRAQDPNDNAWDLQHTMPGATGGEKWHTLTVPELPAHDHDLPGEGGGSQNIQSLVTNDNSDEGRTTGGKSGQTGGGQPHENRQPSVLW